MCREKPYHHNLPLDSSRRQTPPFTLHPLTPPVLSALFFPCVTESFLILSYGVIFPACNSPLSYLEHVEKKQKNNSFVLCRFCPWIASWLCGHPSVERSHNTDKDYLRAGKERMERGWGAKKRKWSRICCWIQTTCYICVMIFNFKIAWLHNHRWLFV